MQRLKQFSVRMASRAGDTYSYFYAKYPKSSAGLTMAIGAAGCDAFAQYIADPDAKIMNYDHKRIAHFAAYNAVMCGALWQLLYNVYYPKWFRGSHLSTSIQATIFDNFVQTPLVYLPSYYAYKSLAESRTLVDGMQDYRRDGVKMVFTCAAVWVPAQFITFFYCPPQYRILFNAVVGLGWDVLLSYLVPMKTDGDMPSGTISHAVASTGSADAAAAQ